MMRKKKRNDSGWRWCIGCLKGGPEPSNFEDLCLVNVSVKYFSKLCVGTSKIQLNWNIWKPSLKSSPLYFSGQRFGNTSLLVFLRFHSFSLVVKWPELHGYNMQIFDMFSMSSQLNAHDATLSAEGRGIESCLVFLSSCAGITFCLFITSDQ